MSRHKCSYISLMPGQHMLGLEECYTCPASFVHKHSSVPVCMILRTRRNLTQLPLKPNADKTQTMLKRTTRLKLSSNKSLFILSFKHLDSQKKKIVFYQNSLPLVEIDD